MKVLLMQRPGSVAPFDRWILAAAPDAQVRIITGVDSARSADSLVDGVDRVMVPDYEGDDATTELLRTCASWRPDAVFANSEDDVLRVAEARVLHDIPGQRSGMALRFRDKVRMKELFAGLSVRAVPFAAPRCVEEVLDALRLFGHAVLKPRQGAGSVGVHVLLGADDVRRVCTPAVLRDLACGRLMVEPYVRGDVYHIDILALGNRALLVSPSRYRHPPHLFRQHAVASIMLDDGGAEFRRLYDLGREFVAQLPADHGANLMHLEVFGDEEGHFLAGEVACRGGGGLVRHAIRHTYGIDTVQQACLLAAGLSTPAMEYRRTARPSGMYLATAGAPAPWPDEPPAWVVDTVVPGDTVRNTSVEAHDSVDAAVNLLVEGDDEAQIEERMRVLDAARLV